MPRAGSRTYKYEYENNGYKNRARAQARAEGRTHFIGVDGEGWTDAEGTHRYAQLSVGSDTIFGWEHLDFTEICEFLWNCFCENPRAAYVGFFLGYDFSQWFRTLPEDRARMLLSKAGMAARARKNSGGNTRPFPVEYNGWEFDVLGTKRFKLRRIGEEHWMNICDTGAFFQASFLTVIDPKGWPDGAPATDTEYQTILEGKSHRADDWTRESWVAAERDLTNYNCAENIVLSRVMQRYEEGLRSAGVKLGRDEWYGPGAAAQGWMKLRGLATREIIEDVVPREILEFARESYYGGWFEVFVHGIVPGTAYEYDINSAYPAAMAVMPCWWHCEYEWSEERELSALPDLAVVDASTTGSNRIVGSGLHRRKDGTIARPSQTRGVRWLHELRAGVEAHTIDSVQLHRVLIITPRECGCDALSAGIPEIYKKRLEVGKNTAHGKAFKLIYNSAYGKQAQSIGSPKFSNPLSASFITSHCRTQILTAIATHPSGTSDLLMIATDGLYFRSPHPTLSISPTELGKWDEVCKNRLTIVMPGVHYDDAGRTAASSGTYAKLRSRGIPGAGLAAAIGSLDQGFARLLEDPNDPSKWPVLDIPIRFQVQSPTSALAQNNWGKAGAVSRDVERKLSTDPSSKRVGPSGGTLFATGREPYVQDGLVRTFPYEVIGGGQSTPYDRSFGMTDRDMDMGMSPDGDLLSEFWDNLRSQ
jgi:hypothetical protein